MTQHIEEARKLASEWADIEWEDDCAGAIAAALAAAEERGRMAERERCAQIARGLFKQETDGANAALCGLLISNAIIKEPTP